MKRHVARSKISFFLIAIEVLQRLRLVEGGGLDPPADQAFGPDSQLILQHQLQELNMVQTVAAGLLETYLQGLRQPRQPQLGQCLLQCIIHQGTSRCSPEGKK